MVKDYLLVKSGKISDRFRICGIDSTDLAAITCPRPLATVTLPNRKKVRIYAELDADCGKRRKKRDKSEYFVGYRLHTLVAFDAQTGANYPIVNLMAPANHHDNLFLPQLVAFAQAMGLHMDIITADEAYLDTKQNEEIHRTYGVRVIGPTSDKVKPPEYIDAQSGAVYMSGSCETAMRCLGRTEGGHEFGCNNQGCFHAPHCPRCREIPLDTGLFGQIPDQIEQVNDVRDIRRHMERCFNFGGNPPNCKPRIW